MLILAATPIGTLADAPGRLAGTLASADVIAAEDTRRMKRLLAHLDVETAAPILSYFDGNEAKRTDELLEYLTDGATVVVISDAGMPGVSDPGHRIVTAAIEAGVQVTALPGPSAVVTALAVSGLPMDRFCFEGFLPRKYGQRERRLAGLAQETRTVVFFEAPHRLRATLDAMSRAWGDRRYAVICRELSKLHEEVRRGPLDELTAWCSGHDVRGEITIVVAGAENTSPGWDTRSLRELVDEHESQGYSRADAVTQVARQTGERRNVVYEAAHS